MRSAPEVESRRSPSAEIPLTRKEKLVRPGSLRQCVLLCFGVLLALSLPARAAPLTVWNLVLVEVADKTSTNASAVSLREVNPAGVTVQTFNLPSTGADRFTL